LQTEGHTLDLAPVLPVIHSLAVERCRDYVTAFPVHHDVAINILYPSITHDGRPIYS